MVFSYEERVIIKYFRLKFGAPRIVNNHPEYEWNVNDVKELVKKIDDTGDVARKEGSGPPKSARTEENIELVEEMILSQEEKSGTHSTPAETARELDIDCRSVFGIIDQDLVLRPLRKRKMQKLTGSNTEKRIIKKY